MITADRHHRPGRSYPRLTERAAVLEPSGPPGGVTVPTAADGQVAPVLQQDTVIQVERMIREVVTRPGISSFQKIAAALAEDGINVSQMKVKRVLEKTPVGVG